MKPSFPIIILLLILIPAFARSQIFLTEIMFDPLENENADEFVEIWNGTGAPVDLAGFRLSDGTADDAIISAGYGMTLGIRQFGVILDPDYFDDSIIYDNIMPDNCLILTVESDALGDRGLKNSESETVRLFGSSGALVAEYAYSTGNDPGFSDEKIILDGNDSFLNWSDSEILHGTPGFNNSVSPDSVNAAIIAFYAEPPSVQADESVTLKAVVKNTGLTEIWPFGVGFYLDDGDSLLQLEEMFDWMDIGSTDVGQEKMTWTTIPALESGLYLFGAQIQLEGDENDLDNTAFLTVPVGFPLQTVVINEIMYKPLTGEPEWIELYNTSAGFIGLGYWLFADSHLENILTLPSAEIPPHGYALLAENQFPSSVSIPPEVPVLIPNGWNSLNNNGDSLRLFDQTGTVIDSLLYPDNWGGSDNGVSMEKVSPASITWFPSADSAGSTPGRANSVNLPAGVINEVSLTASPELFTPDGDGAGDETVVTVKLPVPYARISLRIFDVNGRLVRFLVENRNIGPEFSVIWNGKWDDGKRGRIGAYIIHLQAISEPYKQKYEAKKVVYIGGKL